MHLSHKLVIERLLKIYPDIPVICSIHSEAIALEHPVIHSNIKKYIAIRPEIKQQLINKFKIDASKIDVIYNPFDCEKLNEKIYVNSKLNKRVLFVGTIDYLRKEAIQDLINTTKVQGNELWIVGKENQDNYLSRMMANQPQVKHFEPTVDIEKYVHQCDEVAGILLGITSIEGWLCGKSAIIYQVDDKGTIKSKALLKPPVDINKFRSDLVAKQIIEKYKEIIYH